MSARHTTLASLFSDIADAIRAKTGGTATIAADNFDTAIASIPTDPSGSCTATDNDILSPKTAYAGGTLRIGTIPTKTDSDITSSNGIVTIPAGYYAQQYTKQGDPTGDANMTSGAQMLSGITAYARGTKYTGSIESQAGQTITPDTATHTINSGVYLTGDIVVNPVQVETGTATGNGTLYPTTGKFFSSVTVNIPEYDGTVI